jgi:hypothetical protein
MAKRRHEEEQTSSSKAAMTGMAVAGLAVAALVIWALTRTVQPAPSVATDIPAPSIEQPATNTLPPLEGMPNPNQATASQQPSPVPPAADENASVKRISVTELQSKLSAKQVTVIDVRDKTTFVASHIPGSLHVPVAQIESQVTFLPKDKPIVTYCT